MHAPEKQACLGKITTLGRKGLCRQHKTGQQQERGVNVDISSSGPRPGSLLSPTKTSTFTGSFAFE